MDISLELTARPFPGVAGAVRPRPRWLVSCTFLFLFIGMCFGFGHATLNRYDPRATGLTDTAQYYEMALFKYREVRAPWRYRILTPTLAGLINTVLPRSAIGTWEPMFLSLLIVNSVLMGLVGLMLMSIARLLTADPTVEIIAPFVYLSSFASVNLHLAGLVDAGEAFFVTAIMLAIMRNTWSLVPVLVVVGVLAKETVAPFGVTFAAAWWLLRWRREGARQTLALAWIGLTVALATTTVLAVRALIGGETYGFHELSVQQCTGLGKVLLSYLSFPSAIVWSFAYLGPLGLIKIRRVPARFRNASLLLGFTVLMLGAYARVSSSNVSRPLFNAIGPLFAISCAILLRDLLKTASALCLNSKHISDPDPRIQ